MTRPGPAARGYDLDWIKLRARHLRAFPFCVACGQKGQHVDHIVPVRQAPHRRLDPFNLQTLCETHHNRATQAFDKGSLRGACRADGTPLDPSHPWQTEDGQGHRARAFRSRDNISSDLKRDWLARMRGR